MFYIKQKNWDKILGYAEEAYEEHKSEIGGMSVMVEDKDGDWELIDVVILKQEISGGNTILEKEALAEYYTKQGMKMGKKNFRFCWWHSHHTMSAFWSGTDLTAIDEFNEGDFSFALVINLKGEYKFRVSVWKPVEVHEDVDLEIVDQKKRCTKKMKKEVEELCSPRVSTWKQGKINTHKTGYGYGYSINKDDETTVDPNQEQLPLYANSYVGLAKPVSEEDINKSYQEIVEEVDSFGDDLTDGTISYKTYKESINDLNKELLKDQSVYKVLLIPRKRQDELLYLLPSQLVVYKDGSEVNIPIDGYGYGYGGYGV